MTDYYPSEINMSGLMSCIISEIWRNITENREFLPSLFFGDPFQLLKVMLLKFR